MTITAKYPGTCVCCGQRITPGQAIEWTKGNPARHVGCTAEKSAPPTTQGRRHPAETKECWECGCRFTRADARKHGGDWNDSYCGC